jgi:hypothetical protein
MAITQPMGEYSQSLYLVTSDKLATLTVQLSTFIHPFSQQQ